MHILGISQAYLRYILGNLRQTSGLAQVAKAYVAQYLKPNLRHISGISQANLRPISGISQANISGIYQAISHAHLSYISEYSQAYHRQLTGISQANLRQIQGISQPNLRFNSGIYKEYFRHISMSQNYPTYLQYEHMSKLP